MVMIYGDKKMFVCLIVDLMTRFLVLPPRIRPGRRNGGRCKKLFTAKDNVPGDFVFRGGDGLYSRNDFQK